ncbi:MAG: LysR family transcriptional regulator [Planctomycetota bacterium]
MAADLPSIDQLAGALRVARTGSFTRAARELQLSQSALSRQVMGLEKRLGLRLFDRIGRSVRLTPAGEQLVARAGPALEEIQRLVVNLAIATGPQGSRVRLGTNECLAIHALPPILQSFAKQHRGTTVAVTCDSDDHLADQVAGGAIDLALTDLDHVPDGLAARPLWNEELVLVLPIGHRARSRSVSSYLREPFILPHPATALRRHIDRVLAAHGIELRSPGDYASVEVIKALVRAGNGLALLPASSIRQETRSGSLAAWPLADLPLRRPVIALTDPRRQPWPAEDELLDALVAYGRG